MCPGIYFASFLNLSSAPIFVPLLRFCARQWGTFQMVAGMYREIAFKVQGATI
jgi:hypothetical protein